MGAPHATASIPSCLWKCCLSLCLQMLLMCYVLANDVTDVPSNELVVMSLLPCWHKFQKQTAVLWHHHVVHNGAILDVGPDITCKARCSTLHVHIDLPLGLLVTFFKKCRSKLFLAGQYIVIGMQQLDDSLQVHVLDLMEWCAHGIVVHGYLHLELLFLILRHVGEHIGPDQGLAGSAHAHWQCFHLFLTPSLLGMC